MRFAPLAIGVLALGLLVAWTQNTTSEWFKGIIYAGSAKKQITDGTGNLLVAGTGAFSANVTVGGTLAVSGATTLVGAVTATGGVGLGQTTINGTLNLLGSASAATGFTIGGTFTNSGGPPVFSTAETGLTAHAGGTQAAALALSSAKFIHVVATVGTAADSVALPAPVLGTCHVVVNEAAANSMQLYAVSPATINATATATGIAVAAKKAQFCCATSTTDYACAGP